MDRVVEINRALNAVAKNKDGTRRLTVPSGPLRAAVGIALRDANAGYKLAARYPVSTVDLDKARKRLEYWYQSLEPGGEVQVKDFDANRGKISQIYIELAGIDGQLNAPNRPGLGAELIASLSRLPDTLGTAIGATAGFIGDTAGSIVGGLLAGLWPLLVLVGVVLVVGGKFKK